MTTCVYPPSLAADSPTGPYSTDWTLRPKMLREKDCVANILIKRLRSTSNTPRSSTPVSDLGRAREPFELDNLMGSGSLG